MDKIIKILSFLLGLSEPKKVESTMIKPKKKPARITVKKTSRKISKIIIHCSATSSKIDVGVKEIRRWHTDKGWNDIGYHLVIRRNGKIEEGRSIDIMGAHTRGYNRDSIGICMIGGVDEYNDPDENFTGKQWVSLRQLLKVLRADYKKATIHGHNEFSNKACPSFDVQRELSNGRLA